MGNFIIGLFAVFTLSIGPVWAVGWDQPGSSPSGALAVTQEQLQTIREVAQAGSIYKTNPQHLATTCKEKGYSTMTQCLEDYKTLMTQGGTNLLGHCPPHPHIGAHFHCPGL